MMLVATCFLRVGLSQWTWARDMGRVIGKGGGGVKKLGMGRVGGVGGADGDDAGEAGGGLDGGLVDDHHVAGVLALELFGAAPDEDVAGAGIFELSDLFPALFGFAGGGFEGFEEVQGEGA